MEGKYPIIIDDALAGTLEVTKKGAMTVFDARCKGTDELLRLSVYGDDGEGYLGVMVPEGGEMRLRRSLSPLSMRGFPEEIVAAGPAGRGNAGHQGTAEEPAAARSGGGEEREATTPNSAGGEKPTVHAEKSEAKPPEKPQEESGGSTPCEADCGEVVSPAPPETCGTSGEQEGGTPCEKPPKQREERTPSKKPPEQQEGGTSGKKPPERQEGEKPSKKPPKQQEGEKPGKKPLEQQERETSGKKPPMRQEGEKPSNPAGTENKKKASAAPSGAENASSKAEDLCWYASPDGALVCFDGERSLIALPPKDERIPQGVPGQPRQIEGRDYLVYMTKNGRIVS